MRKILSFETTWWMGLGIMLSKVSQLDKDKYCMLSLICGIQTRKKKKFIGNEINQTCGYQK